jgi:hypothetical protein
LFDELLVSGAGKGKNCFQLFRGILGIFGVDGLGFLRKIFARGISLTN